MSGRAATAGGLKNLGKSAASGAKSPLRKAMSAIRDNFNAGQAGASSSPAASSASTAGGVGPPAWAKAMKRRQAMMHGRSEEHTSELKSLMRNSSAVLGMKK